MNQPNLSKRRLAAIAWHEAGHAVMSDVLGIPVKIVSISHDYGGLVQNGGGFPRSDSAMQKHIMIALAGELA